MADFIHKSAAGFYIYTGTVSVFEKAGDNSYSLFNFFAFSNAALLYTTSVELPSLVMLPNYHSLDSTINT
jgi:hypothetical protein